MSPVSLSWRMPILGLQPICGARFLPALCYTVHSKKYNFPKNTCMGQGIITLGWVLCPRARSCSTCHHGTLMCPCQQGHPDSAAGDTCVSPWLLLPWYFMTNISYVEKSRAGHPNLVLPCVDTRSSLPPGMLQVPWGATNPPRAARGVSGSGGRLGLGGAGSWAGDDVLRGSEELCTSGFLTLAFNIPPQPDGKNK